MKYSMPNQQDVREFYDDFSHSTLEKDFDRPNKRQMAIRNLCRDFIQPTDHVLEIGCGVGIITKSLRALAAGTVSIDISPENVKRARDHCKTNTCDIFITADVLHAREKLLSLGPFDVILMADVLEHIPRDHHRELFTTIESLLNESGRAIFSYPSCEYQEYLRRHKPDALQIVDESLKLMDILAVTALQPVYYRCVDMWGKRQYVHLVLSPVSEYRPSPPDRYLHKLRSLPSRILWRLLHYRSGSRD